MFFIRRRLDGEYIDSFRTAKEAADMLKIFEQEDKEDGFYTPDYYYLTEE